MASYELEHERNALSPDIVIMRIEGMLELEQAKKLLEEVKETFESASDEYVFVNDIREFEPLPQDGVDTIEQGKQLLHEYGASAVIRVVGDSVVGKMQFERPGEEYSFFEATAEDMEQARELIEKWENRE